VDFPACENFGCDQFMASEPAYLQETLPCFVSPLAIFVLSPKKVMQQVAHTHPPAPYCALSVHLNAEVVGRAQERTFVTTPVYLVDPEAAWQFLHAGMPEHKVNGQEGGEGRMVYRADVLNDRTWP
jgi:hypothetical protein